MPSGYETCEKVLEDFRIGASAVDFKSRISLVQPQEIALDIYITESKHSVLRAVTECLCKRF